jgi:NAD(P)-dependent dehydrogenase (short-subunit alcohol dehydrogenase family)
MLTATPTATATAPAEHKPELLGQTVVVVHGSAGIGLETARRARAEGAHVMLTGDDRDALKRFFDRVLGPIDHVVVAAGAPHYGPLPAMEAAQGRDAVSEALALEVARNAVGKMRPGGTLLLVGDTAVSPPFTAALAAALAVVRVRVNVIAPGFVDVSALAVNAMANTTPTGATYDIDSGEQLLARGV